MSDLTERAAERCAELTGPAWGPKHFTSRPLMDGPREAFRTLVEQAHAIANVAATKYPDLADWLAPLILPEPVDPDLLIAREAEALYYEEEGCPGYAADVRAGLRDDNILVALRAVKLYKERARHD